jgi:hypothetical protein
MDASSGGRLLASLRLAQAPTLTVAHRGMGVAAVLGGCFVVTHVVTIAVTFAIAGFDVPVQAFVLDTMGFLAGALFAVLCRQSSNRCSADFRAQNGWICAWAVMTIGVRVVDTLMLFGIVKWGAVYETPTGAILFSNLISEVVFGLGFVITALVSALMLLLCPKDTEEGGLTTSLASN